MVHYKGYLPKLGAYHLTNRASENYSQLKDPSRRKDFFDPVKYIPLGHPDIYLTLDGEQRIRFESISNGGNINIASARLPNGTLRFGAADDLGMLRTRTVVGAALNVTDYFKAYAQIVSGQQFGGLLPGRTAPAVYDSPAQLVQAFVEPKAHIGDADLGVRIGRQLATFGNGFFMQTNPRTNVPRPILDGALGYIDLGNLRLDAFSFKVVNTDAPAFQEQPSNVNLRGAYLSYDIISSDGAPGRSKLTFEPFYFNYDSTYSSVLGTGMYYDRAFVTGGTITPGSGFTFYNNDERHTFGARIHGAIDHFDYDLSGAYQAGRYGPYDVRAFTAQAEVGYQFLGVFGTPHISLRGGLASGGADAQARTISTYQPMSAPLNYTESSLLSLTNIYHLTERLRFTPFPQVPFITAELFNASFWRYSENDAVYAGTWELANLPNTFAVTAAVPGSYIGTQPGVRLVIAPDMHTRATVTFAKLFVGPALANAGGKDMTYTRLDLTYRF